MFAKARNTEIQDSIALFQELSAEDLRGVSGGASGVPGSSLNAALFSGGSVSASGVPGVSFTASGVPGYPTVNPSISYLKW